MKNISIERNLENVLKKKGTKGLFAYINEYTRKNDIKKQVECYLYLAELSFNNEGEFDAIYTYVTNSIKKEIDRAYVLYKMGSASQGYNVTIKKKYLEEAIRLKKKNRERDEILVLLYIEMSSLLKDTQIKEAIGFAEDAIGILKNSPKIVDKNKKYEYLGHLYYDIGNNYEKDQNYKKAGIYFERAIPFISLLYKDKQVGTITHLSRLVYTYMQTKEYKKVIKYGEMALSCRHSDDYGWRAGLLEIIGNACEKEGETKKAIKYLEELIKIYSRDDKYKSIIINALPVLLDIYEKHGMSNKIKQYNKKYAKEIKNTSDLYDENSILPKMHLRCENGHHWSIPLLMIQQERNICPVCSKNANEVSTFSSIVFLFKSRLIKTFKDVFPKNANGKCILNHDVLAQLWSNCLGSARVAYVKTVCAINFNKTEDEVKDIIDALNQENIKNTVNKLGKTDVFDQYNIKTITWFLPTVNDDISKNVKNFKDGVEEAIEYILNRVTENISSEDAQKLTKDVGDAFWIFVDMIAHIVYKCDIINNDIEKVKKVLKQVSDQDIVTVGVIKKVKIMHKANTIEAKPC